MRARFELVCCIILSTFFSLWGRKMRGERTGSFFSTVGLLASEGSEGVPGGEEQRAKEKVLFPRQVRTKKRKEGQP